MSISSQQPLDQNTFFMNTSYSPDSIYYFKFSLSYKGKIPLIGNLENIADKMLGKFAEEYVRLNGQNSQSLNCNEQYGWKAFIESENRDVYMVFSFEIEGSISSLRVDYLF